LEIEFELLGWVEVVQDDKSAGWLSTLKLTKVNGLSGEGCHRAVVVEVGSAQRQVFIELHFFGLVLLKVISISSQSQGIALLGRSLDVTDLNR
jgi:hypothetical protein